MRALLKVVGFLVSVSAAMLVALMIGLWLLEQVARWSVFN